jgi:hypothetical protein
LAQNPLHLQREKRQLLLALRAWPRPKVGAKSVAPATREAPTVAGSAAWPRPKVGEKSVAPATREAPTVAGPAYLAQANSWRKIRCTCNAGSANALKRRLPLGELSPEYEFRIE